MSYGAPVRILTALFCAIAVAGVANATALDPFLWLEDVHGARALTWVKAQNAKTLAVLRADPRFARFDAQALAIGEAKDRIPVPRLLDGQIYNFWQDGTHVRGIWRRTTIAQYAASAPVWTTVLDLDALAKTEGRNWFFQGADCDSPSRRRCLISLSEGGEDASTVREFDLGTGRFVPGGFTLPHGKQDAAWADADTLLVSREWRPGELTASGYPYVVKRLRRGKALADATELYRGTKADVGTDPFEFSDGGGQRVLGVVRHRSFFETETRLLTPSGLRVLAVPRKSDLAALLAGRLLVRLNEPWHVNGASFGQGSLVALDLQAVRNDPAHPKPALVYGPGPRATLAEVAATRARLIVTTYENVRGRAAVYAPEPGGRWSRHPLDVPDNSSIDISAASDTSDDAYLSVTGYLTPTTLRSVDTRTLASSIVKRLPPRFEGSRDLVEQRTAISTDGTRVPYFVVRPKRLRRDGQNPTILYGYGGFQISLTPSYSGALGKLWLERGGVYAVANIRGGGEFGPAWHEAALTIHRQRAYDDFAAVAKTLIATRITSPRHLGIEGGSNGGLLMGVEFTQHPELFRAVDIQVPLLDMLRFEKIAAGASWVGEYGSVARPAQRAFLAKISPYNNLRPGVAYPEPFIWTTTKDDRVGPQHARKFAAKLAALHVPYLYYEVLEGGHGAGANLAERAFTSALEYTYFARRLGN
jgi:prolyl oligopeptidase